MQEQNSYPVYWLARLRTANIVDKMLMLSKTGNVFFMEYFFYAKKRAYPKPIRADRARFYRLPIRRSQCLS